MKIDLELIKIKDLIKNFSNDNVTGEVLGWDNKLNIRPPYQREFIYKDKQQKGVIKTIFKNFPLNVMYFAKNNQKYELIDGQQRILSICNYASSNFSVDEHFYHSLPKDKKEIFDNYELSVYVCEGDEDEKIEWFETINIAGEKLTNQELRNAIYSGPFISKLKTYFSRSNGPASNYKEYLKGSSIRQEWLETILKWASKRENLVLNEFISKYRNNPKKAEDIWYYFEKIMDWKEVIFPYDKKYLKFMKGVEWGYLYENFKGFKQNLSNKVIDLILDDEIKNKKGIFEYLLTGNEKHLNLRSFSYNMKNSVLIKQDYKCAKCGKEITIETSEADHMTPWSEGGKTEKENCQILCKECNRKKGKK